jgi:putative ABC transport system permease protein
MLKNYLKIALRNLLRQKAFSFINIAGLALAMAACLLIMQYVRFEWSYDGFHGKGSRIYRVRMDRYMNGEFQYKSAKTYPNVGSRLKADVPGVEEFVRLLPEEGVLSIPQTETVFQEDRILFADASFFEVFSLKLMAGDATKALSAPNAAVLSETTARKYFGEQDPLGKTLTFHNDSGREEVYTVTGVCQDMPENSHFAFDLLFSYRTLSGRWGALAEDNWQVDDYYTYLLLRPGTSPASV